MNAAYVRPKRPPRRPRTEPKPEPELREEFVNGFRLIPELEHGLVYRCFKFVQNSVPRVVNRVPIPPYTSDEEQQYTLRRMKAAGWEVRIHDGFVILVDPPRTK